MTKLYDFHWQKCIETSNGNVIISPYSVAVALTLLSEGAKGNTFEQIKNGLHLQGDKNDIAEQFSASANSLTRSSGNATLNIANKVYTKEGATIKKAFNDIAVGKFKSEVQAVNFGQSAETSQVINTWVEDKTNHKIKDLISADSLDASTRLVLVNAIYFKGKWLHEFDKKNTHKDQFWVSDDKSVEVDYMYLKDRFDFGYIEELDAQAIELKYAGSDISLLVILPSTRSGLSEVESKLKNFDLTQIHSHLHSREVELTLPKFKIEYSIELKDTLQKVVSVLYSLPLSALLNVSSLI